MGFSDVDSAGSDVGAEVSEVENRDTDFGDGDGVNDFDETYKEMNSGGESLEYFEEFEGTDSSQTDVNTDNTVNQSDMTTDQMAADALSDFEDDTDASDNKTTNEDYYSNEVPDRNVDTSSSEDIDQSQAESRPETDGDANDESNTEKTAVFENVSYHQGQNDLGALGTCGPTSIANSLNRVTGTADYSENIVLHNAMDNNLCHKSDDPYSCGATTTKDVVNIIDNVKSPDSNIHTEVYEYDKAISVDDLANRLEDSGTVAMVGVDSATLWDQSGDVASSGLFQHTDSPSDHWITVDSPIRDEAGNLTGFNVIDSGGGVSEVSRDKFEAMYMGDANHSVSDPTAILISDSGEGVHSFSTSDEVEEPVSD